MGRKKQYDRDELVGQAVEIFRDHGFAGSSTQMLVDGLGVNRFSLYAEFGNKQELFEAALRRYDDDVLGGSYGPLEAPGAGLAEVQALLEFYGAAGASPTYGRGCLLCNTAVEFGPLDPGDSGLVQRYFQRLSGAFRAALGNARDRGGLSSSADLDDEASFFTASVLGMFVMLRAKAPPEVIEGAARVAIEHLGSLRASRADG